MKFWEKVTGSDITKEFKAFGVRAKSLPEDYQIAWEKIKYNLWEYSDFTGRNLLPIFDGILDLLEEGIANGQRVEEVLGEDIKGFCSELVGTEASEYFRDKWRKQLNSNIYKKLDK